MKKLWIICTETLYLHDFSKSLGSFGGDKREIHLTTL